MRMTDLINKKGHRYLTCGVNLIQVGPYRFLTIETISTDKLFHFAKNILSFLLPLFQEGQLSVTGESMCTKYWLTA